MRHVDYMKQRFKEERMNKQRKQDRRGIRFAYASAADSYDSQYQVGAVIVKDGVILSDGYNGAPRNFPNITRDERGETLSTTLHAEANAIAKLARTGRSSDGATIYCTHSPCVECSKLLHQAGIKRVVYAELYRNTNLDLIRGLGIEVDKYEEDPPSHH